MNPYFSIIGDDMSFHKKQTRISARASALPHDLTSTEALLHYCVGRRPLIDTDTHNVDTLISPYPLSDEQKKFDSWLSDYIAAKKIYQANDCLIRDLNAGSKNLKTTVLDSHSAAPDVNCHGEATHRVTHLVPPTAAWLLTQQDRLLVQGTLQIPLTPIESALINKMLHPHERVVSKEELIRHLGREPEHYRGLEMCLSRLQSKFKTVSQGERLFRAVRNRGYCLIQKINKPTEANHNNVQTI